MNCTTNGTTGNYQPPADLFLNTDRSCELTDLPDILLVLVCCSRCIVYCRITPCFDTSTMLRIETLKS